jgi:hypothetical protein
MMETKQMTNKETTARNSSTSSAVMGDIMDSSTELNDVTVENVNAMFEFVKSTASIDAFQR